METDKVTKWFETLVASKKFPLSKDEINAAWNPIREKLSLKEQIKLLISLVQQDSVFKWLHLISYLLPDLFSEDENFVKLIEIVIDKIHNDMAQGPFIRSLIEIGERNPEKGIRFYNHLTESRNDLTISYSGLILGGAAKKDFSKTFEVIEKGLKEGNNPVKVACMRAIRVAFEKDMKEEFPQRVLDYMNAMLKTDDFVLKAEIIKGYVDFDKFNPQKCEQKLLQLATTPDSNVRYVIVDTLWFNNLTDTSKEVDILKACVEDSNRVVLERLVWVLGTKGQNFLEDSLEMMKMILKKPASYVLPEIDYYVGQLCKDKPGQCLSTFSKWLEDEKDQLFLFRAETLLEKMKLTLGKK